MVVIQHNTLEILYSSLKIKLGYKQKTEYNHIQKSLAVENENMDLAYTETEESENSGDRIEVKHIFIKEK